MGEQVNGQVNEPLLVAAREVMARAFEIASAIMAVPLSVMAKMYWARTVKKSGINPKTIGEVDADTFVASSTGVLYWVPPGLEPIGQGATMEETDEYLARNCVKMARVTVDQIKVPMEQPFWHNNAASASMKQLDGQVEAAFESVLEVMQANKTDDGVAILSTVPVMTFTESRDNPFMGLLTICCRCGYWKPVIPTKS